MRRGYESSDRSVDDLNPPPRGPAPGARQPTAITHDGLVVGDRIDGYCGFCGDVGHRAKDCTALTGERVQCSPPEAGDTVWVYDRPHTLLADGTLREHPPESRCATCGVACCHGHPIDWLIARIFCTACLCLRIHPTHLLVCSDHRRKVIHRARARR